MDIPVVLIGPDGELTSDPVVGCPCIRISISANEDGTPKNYSVWALLDTGADNIFVDTGLSDAVGAIEIGTGPVHSATQILKQPIYEAFIFIEGCPTLKTGYTAIPLPRSHSRYHVVLGRAFLRFFEFHFDRQTQAFSLSLPSEGSEPR